MSTYKIFFDKLKKKYYNIAKFDDREKLIPTKDMVNASVNGVILNLYVKYNVSDLIAKQLIDTYKIKEMYENEYYTAIQFGYENVATELIKYSK